MLEEKIEEARQREFEAKTLQEELEQAKIIISQRLFVKAEGLIKSHCICARV